MDELSTNKIFNFADCALSLPIETLEVTLKRDSGLVNCKGYGGQTALHKAVLMGNHVVALILLRCGADPNMVTTSGETSVHIACSRGALKILSTLLSFGGDLSVCNQNGHYPIHCAALTGSIVVVQFLSEVCGCNLEMVDKNGATVLHSACVSGSLDLVKFLLKFKKLMCLDLDNNGNSVLHVTATSGLSGTCWAILDNGGESLLVKRNANGHTPLQIAQNSLSVSRDCKHWLEKWTKEYEKNRKISNPKWDWLILLSTPFLISHISVILSMIIVPERQWLIGLPGFFILLFIMRKQDHRIRHPVRWANPVFVAAYTSGLFSTIACLFISLNAYQNVSTLHFIFIFTLVVLIIYFLFYLLKRDPGRIPSNGYCKDALINLAEDRLEGRFCAPCFIGTPPGSHHCRLCETCYLYLDHHCLFLNTCVAANNHWHFVVFAALNVCFMMSFILTCLNLAPISTLDISVADWLVRVVQYWMCYNVWVMLLFICNIASLLWGISLLRYQFRVIGSQQTTYYRIKTGSPKTFFSTREKIVNFCKFVYYKKVVLASNYFQA